MALPYFFLEELNEKTIQLDEDTSKHMIGVLRMEKGEEVLLTDGKGTKARAAIVDDNRSAVWLKLFLWRKKKSRHHK